MGEHWWLIIGTVLTLVVVFTLAALSGPDCPKGQHAYVTGHHWVLVGKTIVQQDDYGCR